MARSAERTPQRSVDAEDWASRLGRALDGLASELCNTDSNAAEELHAECVRLLTGLAFAALLARRDSNGASSTPAPTGKGFEGLLERVEAHAIARFHEARGAFVLLRQERFSDGLAAELDACASDLSLRAGSTPDGVVQELGALHECLLRHRFERLALPARRLRHERAWLSPARLLSCAPELRSRRLQSDFGLSKSHVDRLAEPLARARSVRDIERCLQPLLARAEPAQPAGVWVIQPSLHQRRSGAHYTPWRMCQEVVAQTLDPLVSALPEPRSAALLGLKVCDPAMGPGCFLLAATALLAEALTAAWRAEGVGLGISEAELHARARARIASEVICGVDKNVTAVCLARMSLWLFASNPTLPELQLERTLRHGDALLGDVSHVAESTSPAPPEPAFDWRREFAEVFARDNPGFDALIGNPPWVAFVGRAAQPLDPALAAYYAATNPAFKRYRTLHGLFVYRSASLLRQGGRLGLVLPTSVADLDGYGATRAAHDRLCEVDRSLPDWGDGAFTGVFQPAMALLSTRRSKVNAAGRAQVWPLTGEDLPGLERALLKRLAALPKLPAELFGERGFQTSSDDRAHLRQASAPAPPYSVPLREGSDIGEFCALSPRVFAHAEHLGSRLRSPAEYRKVALLIRQTARFPIAALSDGRAFRNSILAGFENPEYPAALLLCFLNSTLARWFHFRSHRDARQGMPQLKIGHLRALPALPRHDAGLLGELARLGTEIGARNAGLEREQRAQLDDLVSTLFELDPGERDVVENWSRRWPLPVLRRALQDTARSLTGGPSGELVWQDR